MTLGSGVSDPLSEKGRVARQFGLANVNLDNKRLESGDISVDLDAATTGSNVTVTLPPGGSIMIDPSEIDPKKIKDQGFSVWGTYLVGSNYWILSPITKFGRWFGGEPNMIKIFNTSKTSKNLDLTVEGTNVTAVDLSKVGKGVWNHPGAFIASVADKGQDHSSIWGSWKLGLSSIFGVDPYFKGAVNGSNIVLMRTHGTLNIDKLHKGQKFLLTPAEQFVMASSNVGRGLRTNVGNKVKAWGDQDFLRHAVSLSGDEEGFVVTSNEAQLLWIEQFVVDLLLLSLRSPRWLHNLLKYPSKLLKI